MSTSNVIACTLKSSAYADRVQHIAALNRDHLRQHRHQGRSLELIYDTAATAGVDELVRLEAQCCSFLQFAVTVSGNATTLVVLAPDGTEETAVHLFAPFLAGVPRAGGR